MRTTDSYGFTDSERKCMDAIFASFPHIERVMLFGSRAKGTYRPFSDVDITLFGRELTPDDYYGLCNKLEDSDLPFFYDVSIFDNLTNKEFINHIRRVGKFIYSRSKYDGGYSKMTDNAAEPAPAKSNEENRQ